VQNHFLYKVQNASNQFILQYYHLLATILVILKSLIMKQQLSPKKYIETRARTLPIYKCLINKDWEDDRFGNVIVVRRHSNNNITAGLYLMDLLCLGVKDTSYIFNDDEEVLLDFIEKSDFIEIEYNLAHNIIYAGHDYAYEFEIAPHKDFAITKFILEEDNDSIPLIDIEVGDEEDGFPHLIVSRTYNYEPIIEKLKTYAGEDNFYFTTLDEYGNVIDPLEDRLRLNTLWDEDWEDGWDEEVDDFEDDDADTENIEDAEWEDADNPTLHDDEKKHTNLPD
jgi:hypothetical protein